MVIPLGTLRAIKHFVFAITEQYYILLLLAGQAPQYGPTSNNFRNLMHHSVLFFQSLKNIVG